MTDDVRAAWKLFLSEADDFVKKRLLLALLLVVASSVLTALGPLALKLAVDTFNATTPWSGGIGVFLLILAYAASQWLARSLAELRGLVFCRAERRFLRRLGRSLFAHVMHLPLRFHVDRQTGALSQASANGLQGCQLILHHAAFTVLPVGLELLTVAVVLVHVDQAEFLGFFLVTLVAYAIVFTRGVKRIAAPAQAASVAHMNANAVLTDSMLNYETVKYFTAESLVHDRYDRELSCMEAHWIRFHRCKTVNGIQAATVFAVALVGSMAYAGHQVASGAMTLGGFILINTYMLQLVRPIEMLGFAVQDLSQGIAFLEKMLALFRQPRESRNSDRLGSPIGQGKLVFDRVRFGYDSPRTVLNDVSFSVAPGRTLGIVGASGAGKSSLIRLLVRLYEPDSGRILLDDRPIAELEIATLRQAIAVVPQDTVLFNDTIAYNVGFGRPGSTRQEIERAARLAHLHDFIVHLPAGYDTMVGERGIKLSGGERQRVAIARAMLKEPRLFVFDEATSSLDSQTERQILQNFREVSCGNTALIIAHRLSTVLHADEILVLDKGSVIERGAHAALMEKNGRYASLWRAQHGTAAEGGQVSPAA